jgi:hypothetical protein
MIFGAEILQLLKLSGVRIWWSFAMLIKIVMVIEAADVYTNVAFRRINCRYGA